MPPELDEEKDTPESESQDTPEEEESTEAEESQDDEDDDEDFDKPKALKTIRTQRAEVKAFKAELKTEKQKREAAEQRLTELEQKVTDATELAKTVESLSEQVATLSKEREAAEARAKTMTTNGAIKDAAQAAGFADPEDARLFLNLEELEIDDAGKPKAETLTSKLNAVLEAKPHLKKRSGPTGIPNTPEKDLGKSLTDTELAAKREAAAAAARRFLTG